MIEMTTSLNSNSILFAPKELEPRRIWQADEFSAIDDRIRGGSSESEMKINENGSITFKGFLDTTTLGGAGFASQSYDKGIPGEILVKEKWKGLKITGKSIENNNNNINEGGGKNPVTSFVLNLKTAPIEHRPDGRRKSQIVYEFRFKVPKIGGSFNISSEWNQFEPTFRGKPSPESPPIDPSKINEWSIMARSEFGQQSGSFAIELITLEAISKEEDVEEDSNEKSIQQQSISSFQPLTSSSTENFGFAMYIVATVIFIIWIFWALTPDSILNKIGIDWYPNREWAFLIPAWSLFAVLFIYAAFLSLNIMNTSNLDDLNNVVDSYTNTFDLEKVENGKEKHPLEDLNALKMQNDIYDLPPGYVSRQRFGMN